MKGRKDHEAAAREASEEAGVTGRVHKHPMGAYTYAKRLTGGAVEHVRVMVYLLEVVEEIREWRETDQRTREWLSTEEAARRVDEDGLAKIIRQFDVAAFGAED